MTTQTEAERLADALNFGRVEWQTAHEAAAELRRLVSFNQQLMDEVARLNKAVADAIAEEREACGRARAAKPRELKPVGRGTLLDEQQYCFDKGWREGAASVRNAIRARKNT